MKAKQFFRILYIYFKKISYITICIIIFDKLFIKLREIFYPFFTINSISISVNSFNSTFVFLSSLAMLIWELKKNEHDQVYIYISIHLSLKFSNTSASNNVSLKIYKSLLSPISVISDTFHTFQTHSKRSHSFHQ